MDFKSMQTEVDEWISQYGGYWPPLSMMARLTEETGELARELNHIYGMKKRKPEEGIKSVEGELGDMIITLACIANYMHIDLDKAYEETMTKVNARDKDRTKKE